VGEPVGKVRGIKEENFLEKALMLDIFGWKRGEFYWVANEAGTNAIYGGRHL